MQIGPYTINTLETGEFALDGGAMFGIVPRPLWETKIGVDARNRIDMRMRCLLIRGEIDGTQRTILVDTGIGDKWSDKERDIYRIDHSTHNVDDALAAHNVSANDVTDVILTHLHFDHAGGATKHEGDRIVATFPNATYYVQENHLAWAQNPTGKDAGSFIAHDFQPLVDSGQLQTVRGPRELFPGIHLRLSHGHTTSMQHPLICDDTTKLFYAADLLPTSLHVRAPWIMAYDIRPLISLEEKLDYLREAHEEQWVVCFEHCPLMDACTIQDGPRGLCTGDPIDLN